MSKSDNHRDYPEDGRQDPAAVALAYRPGSESAPKVVASGRGSIAEQILNIAFANNIKVREDADLVELLSAVDVGEEIPLAAFAAVAEILVYVYRANGAMPSSEERENVNDEVAR